jgi:exodeoxyribonuclease VII small subunit
MTRPKPLPPPASYEAAVRELEELTARLEAGQLPLDQMLGAYQRGNDLLRYCESQLQSLQQQIQILDDGGGPAAAKTESP